MKRSALAAAIAESVRLSFARAGGPGGQNVNRRATKVTARLPLASLGFLGEEQQARVRARMGARINAEGEIVVQVAQERQQVANRKVAIERLAALLEGALRVRRRRKATRPTAAAQKRRLEAKRRRGQAKRLRGDAAREE